MKIRFWGVRGSFPVSSAHAIRYGGNTPCLEIDTGGRTIVIDAGTGIRGLGKSALERGRTEFDLLLSHAHWDHIQGFPHFEPLQRPDARVTVYSLSRPGHSLEGIIGGQQQQAFYPVSLDQVRAELRFVELSDGETFALGDARIQCRRLNHPGVAGGFRIEADGATFAYICDTDLNGDLLHADVGASGDDERRRWLEELRQGARDLGHGADLLVCDTFFLSEEYDPHWGHSRPEDFLALAAEAGAGTMCLFHHRPGRTDDELDALVASYRSRTNGTLKVVGSREGLEFVL
jgi:ribonuclease BN (tRNA processing enzyme)